jgi:molybdenum cofactor biosynthesis enzyme MoaA
MWKGEATYQFTEFDQWVNSQDMRQVREDLHHGVKINQCSRCWNDESVGKKSLRQIYNVEFSKNFDFSLIDTDNWEVTDSICTFDFKLGNLCNLKCVMCHGNSSSQIMSEFKQHRSKFETLEMFRVPNTTVSFDWPITTEFQDFLQRFKNQIKWIKFTGGEPTVIPYVAEILETIPNPESVTVNLTTNGTKINNRLLDTLKKFKAIWLNVSLEGIGQDNDVIRYPSIWSEIESTIIDLSQLPNTYFSISHVLQCFSVKTLIPLLKWCDIHNLKMQLILLVDPAYLNINSIDTKTIQKFADELHQTTLTTNQSIVKQVLEVLKDHKYDPILHQQRTKYLTILDNIRNTNLCSLV